MHKDSKQILICYTLLTKIIAIFIGTLPIYVFDIRTEIKLTAISISHNSAQNSLSANGDMKLDFTYIDDIVEGIICVMKRPPERRTGNDGLPLAPYALYNIGGGQPENL